MEEDNKPEGGMYDDIDTNDTPSGLPVPAVYEKLKGIRSRTDLEVRATKHLKDTFTGFDGQEHPLRLRYYQIQGMMHLLAMERFLLGDDVGLGKCRTLDTRVCTNLGMVTLSSMGPEVRESDTFYPLSQPTLVWTGWEWAPVKRFYAGGVKPTRKVTTRRGYQVEGTLVHPLWVRDSSEQEKFVPMRDISENSYLCLYRGAVDFPSVEPNLPVPSHAKFAASARAYSVPGILSPNLAALLGYIISEAWTNSANRVYITQDRILNEEVHDHIRSLCESEFGWVGNENSQRRDFSIHITSVYLRSYLEGLGVGLGLSATKSVPWPIFQATRESVAAFLRSYFDSEGSVYGDVVEVSSASEKLLQEVQNLLLRFGIVGTRKPKKVKGRDHTYWRLSICGDDARRFGTHIGFATPRKAESLRLLMEKKSNPNLDVIPHARQLVRDLRTAIVRATARDGGNGNRKGSGLKQFGVPLEKGLNCIENRGYNLTYGFLQKLLTVAKKVGADNTGAYQSLEETMSNGFFYDPIVSIEEGEAEVADIEVDHPRHSFVADGTINHNTIQAISALCYLWERDPNLRVLILTTKSSIEQWAGEFKKFTKGTQALVCRGTPKQREKIRDAFANSTGPTVLVMGYGTAKQDFSEMQDWDKFVLITDEATAFKNSKTQTHKVVKYLFSRAIRGWALTATLIKNNLMEGWGIYSALVPGLFGSENAFMNEYCIIRMMPVPKSRRQIPMIVGYRARDVVLFREKIDPYFLGRPKFEVASELPPLTIRTVKVDLTPFQQEKYAEALSGLLTVKTAKPGEEEEKEVSPLTAVNYCQQIVNHPELIGCEGDSAKLDALIDMVTDGEFEEERLIIFSRFRKMIDIIGPALKKAGVASVRITGEEDPKERKASQDAFQDPKGKIRVVLITMAAAEAINLQAAKAIIFYDSPWSAGDLIQILGRMIRIGSIHDRVHAIHLEARKTIDERVSQVLAKKMGLVEAVLGKKIKGDDTVIVQAENDLSDLFSSLVSDAKSLQK